MKKLLSILGAVSLTATGTSSVIACNTSHKNQQQKLDEIIKTTDLQWILMAGTVPTKAELLVGIKAKNSKTNNLNENDFDIQGTPAETSATIIGKGNYSGTILLSYTKIIDISKIKNEVANEIINFIDTPLEPIKNNDFSDTKAFVFASIIDKDLEPVSLFKLIKDNFKIDVNKNDFKCGDIFDSLDGNNKILDLTSLKKNSILFFEIKGINKITGAVRIKMTFKD